jgi:hypothetical protein
MTSCGGKVEDVKEVRGIEEEKGYARDDKS